MSTRPVLNPMSPDDLHRLAEGEAMLRLRDDPAFKRVVATLDIIVNAAREELEKNTDPRWDAHIARVYRERRVVVDFMHRYIDAVIDQRRDSIREFFKELGIPDEVIERNQDISLDFMSKFNPEAPNVHANPDAK